MGKTVDTPTPSPTPGLLPTRALRDLAIIALIVVASLKILLTDFKVDLSGFSFSDFLALVLALFSVGLSTAFYFKANEASNQFYDNTYKFTKDMSEILGRIEAGFGERLRNLDEGYNGMRNRLDQMPYYAGATGADVKEEEAQVKRKEDEQRAVIEDLAKKARLEKHEKEALFADLAQKSLELEAARSELRATKAERQEDHSVTEQRMSLIRYIARKMRRVMPAESFESPLTLSKVRQLFEETKAGLVDAAVEDMKRLDLLDTAGRPSKIALVLLRDMLRLP